LTDLILIRGLPGSGKTTFAQIIAENGKFPIVSIDDYFTDPKTGEYHFDYQRNHLAYQSCLERTKAAIEVGAVRVIVHNTFTLPWELEPYLEMANANGCRLFVMTMEKYHGQSNTHEISEVQLQKMATGYQIKLL
jgi:predicted kinase